MLPTVAIVEDEEHLREAVAEYLEGRGFRVLTAGDAGAFREIARSEPVQIAIIDIAMPGEDGLSLARWVRQWPSRPGIIFATASAAPIDRIIGLEVGADDYVVKPYDLRELLARIRSLLRRLPAPAPETAPDEPAARIAKLGRLVVNFDARRVTDREGRSLELTATEFDTLAMLVARPNRLLSRAQLLAGRDGGAGLESDRSIDIRVTRLRRKIDADPGQPSLIRTVRGEGYMYVPRPT